MPYRREILTVGLVVRGICDRGDTRQQSLLIRTIT
jgi:hypothetical protein